MMVMDSVCRWRGCGIFVDGELWRQQRPQKLWGAAAQRRARHLQQCAPLL